MGELLEAVRNYLDITWESPELDRKLTGIINRGKAYLDRIYGDGLDYGEGTKGRELLPEYVRYVRSNALQDFGRDYASELNGLHIDGEVDRFESEWPELQ